MGYTEVCCMQNEIALIALDSAEKIGSRVNQILSEWTTFSGSSSPFVTFMR